MNVDARPVAASERVTVSLLQANDEADFLEMVEMSRPLHQPWCDPPADPAAFRTLVQRAAAPDFVSLLGRRRDDGSITGVVNFSQIVLGLFQNAYCGFYAAMPNAGTGLMFETLQASIDYAFGALRLHRVEANVQPGNDRSLALVRRIGFRHEGYSPRYLFIDGAWRDHERFALTSEEWTPEAGSPSN